MGIQVGLFSVTPAKEWVGGKDFSFCPGSARHDYSESVGQPVGHFECQGFRQHPRMFVLPLTPPAVSVDQLLLMYGVAPCPVVLQVVVLCFTLADILAAEVRTCVRRLPLISTFRAICFDIFSTVEGRGASAAISTAGAVPAVSTIGKTYLV